jgi:hypothetical protein
MREGVRPRISGAHQALTGLSSSFRRHSIRDRFREVTSFLLSDRSMNFDVLNYIDVSTSVNMTWSFVAHLCLTESSIVAPPMTWHLRLPR